LVGWPAAPASAHSELVESTPASGATLDKAPTEVELVFGETVQQQGSSIIVTTSNTVVSVPTSFVASGTTATIQLQPDLRPGDYAVAFRVVSDDGHVVNDTYTFEVRGGSEPTVTADAETPTTSPLAGAGSGSESEDGSGATVVWVLGAGAIGIALVAALIAVAVRGRRGRSS
jgi:methionine-rich copper-binding protein CopC